MRRALLIAGALLAAAVVAVAWVTARGPEAYPIAAASIDLSALTPEQRAELVERGRYIARAANCEACHVSEDGLAFAGGLPLESPFGTFYGTNITPSRAHGIAHWNADDLYRSLHWGVMPDGSKLYPAMPYTSYHHVARADSDAIWAYLASLPPIDKPNRPHDLTFPFGFRPLVELWNLLYRPSAPLRPVEQRGEAWNRGRYLVHALGHCGECHTPRNLLFALKRSESLRGEVLESALAPDVTPDGLTRRGWSTADLAEFLRSGLSAQGTPNFRMASVVSHSTRYLRDDDLASMVLYLFDGREMPPAPRTASATAIAPGEAEPGRDLYLGLCAGCHQADGSGRPFASPPMRTNTTLALRDPLNLVRIVTEGIRPRELGGFNRMQGMPAFGALLSDAEIAALVNYLRRAWGGQDEDLRPERIAELRRDRRG